LNGTVRAPTPIKYFSRRGKMKKALVYMFAVMIAFVFAGTGFAQAPAAAPEKPAATEKKEEKKVEKKAPKKAKKSKKEMKKEEKKEEAPAAPAPAK
jgi:hypothetical protein